MAVLSDTTIRNLIEAGEIVIDPMPEDEAFQPASVDLRLSGTMAHYNGTSSLFEECELPNGPFVLGSTIEYIKIPDFLVARVEGKSKVGRKGLLIHATAGFIDPGFEGNITLELCNLGIPKFAMKADMYICQISFMELDRPAARPYGSEGLKSNFQGQRGPTLSTL